MECKGEWTEQQQAITRVFTCPWGLRKECIDWLLGYAYSISTGDFIFGEIIRRMPDQHPEYPWLYAVAVQEEGLGATCDNPNVFAQNGDGAPYVDPNTADNVAVPAAAYYDRGGGRDGHSCRLTVRYGPLPYEVRTDAEAKSLPSSKGEMERWLQREKTYSMQEISLPPGSLKFMNVDSVPEALRDKDIPANAGRLLIPKLGLRYTWHCVPDVPETAIELCVGRVNSGEFDGARGWRWWPAETCLCLPPQVEAMRTITGRRAWKIVYNFMVQPRGGWNAFPAADGGFYPVRVANAAGKAGTERVFKTANFTNLFRAPHPVTYF